jgi:hypothetical protein
LLKGFEKAEQQAKKPLSDTTMHLAYSNPNKQLPTIPEKNNYNQMKQTMSV